MLRYWIWLAQKNITATAKQRLLEHFGQIQEIYEAGSDALAQVDGLTKEQVELLEDKDLSDAKRILHQCRQGEIQVVSWADSAYPARLKHTHDAPVVLYCRGKLPDWDQRPVIGIVGTRRATSYGLNTALRFSMEIAACGAWVISGGALGIDTMALKGALDGELAPLCVLGCGVDVAYPKANEALLNQVAEKGCLISEYPPGTKPYTWNFPQRNRIISGISNGLLVIEAPAKSGALSTANHALSQGRDVFAVPGNVDSLTSVGSNDLLRQGASAVMSGWDVVREYKDQYPETVRARQLTAQEVSTLQKVAQTPATPSVFPKTREKADKKVIDKEDNSSYSVLNDHSAGLTEEEQAVLAQIPREPCFVDQLIAHCPVDAGRVRSILTRLAMKQLVRTYPGGRISLK